MTRRSYSNCGRLAAVVVALAAALPSAASAAPIDPAVQRAVSDSRRVPVMVRIDAKPGEIRSRGLAVLKRAGQRGRVMRTVPYIITAVGPTGLARLSRDSAVEEVTLNTPIALRPLAAPVAGAAAPAAWSVDYNTGAAAAWATGYTGAGQTIAIIDDGVALSHPWFRGREGNEACFANSIGAANLIPTCTTGAPDEFINGPRFGRGAAAPPTIMAGPSSSPTPPAHGTAAAGALAGAPDRSYGFPLGRRGPAPDAKVMAINATVLYKDPNSEDPDALVMAIAPGDYVAALDWINSRRDQDNVAAVNLSQGYDTPGPDIDSYCSSPDDVRAAYRPVYNAIRSLLSNNVSVVAAATNDGLASVGFPGCMPGVVDVGSVDSDGALAWWTPVARTLSVLAPGAGIRLPNAYGGHLNATGNSFAAPFVAGAIALYKQKYPDATPGKIKNRLMNTGRSVNVRGRISRRSLDVDALLGITWPSSAAVDRRCLQLAFRAEKDAQPNERRGFVRLTCAPTKRQPHRLTVTIDGPGVNLDSEFTSIPLKTPLYYAEKLVKFGPPAKVRTTEGASYRVCYLLYRTEDQLWPSATECKEFTT